MISRMNFLEQIGRKPDAVQTIHEGLTEQALWTFENGFGLSLIYGPGSYGLELGLIGPNGELTHNKEEVPEGIDLHEDRTKYPFLRDQVEGHLEEYEIVQIVETVAGWDHNHPHGNDW